MGIFGGNKTPKPPKPKKVIEQQTAANLQTARTNAQLNRINTVGPYGEVRYSQDPNNPDIYTQTTTLNPDAQQALTYQQQLAAKLSGFANTDLYNQLSSNLGQPFNTDFSTYQDQATNDILARLNPQIDTDRQHAIALLAARGITPESNLDAYNTELDQFNRQANDARTQADLAGFKVGQQYFDNALTARDLPLNELIAILRGTPIQGPNALSPGQANLQPVDVSGIYNNNYQQKLNAAQQDQSGLGSILGLAGTIGGAFLGGPAGAALGSRIGGLFGGSGGGFGGAATPATSVNNSGGGLDFFNQGALFGVGS